MCQEQFHLLPGESQEAYDALLETWQKQYNLTEPAVPELVKTLVDLDWMQRRCRRNICKLEAQLLEAEDANDDARIDRIERRLTNAYRYKTAAENSFQRALRALEKFRSTRKRDELNEAGHQLRAEHTYHKICYGFAKLGLPIPNLRDKQKPESETPKEFVP